MSAEKLMKVEELQKVSEGLSWIAGRLADIPDNKEDAIQAALICSMANQIVGEFTLHLVHSVEPYEALRRAAVGEMKVDEEKATILKILTAKPKE